MVQSGTACAQGMKRSVYSNTDGLPSWRLIASEYWTDGTEGDVTMTLTEFQPVCTQTNANGKVRNENGHFTET